MENQNQFEATMRKYGYWTNKMDAEFIQMPIDYIKACIKYCRDTVGFAHKIPQFEKDLSVLCFYQAQYLNKQRADEVFSHLFPAGV